MNIRQGSITFLKVIIFVLGIAVLALCIYWLPVIAIKETKTRAGDYSLYPILGFVYGCCIAFFVALYQSFRLLSYIERNDAFSELSLRSLKFVKKSTLTIIFFIILGIVYVKVLSIVTRDDPAGFIALSLMGALVTSIITAILDVLEKLLKNLLDTKKKELPL